MRWAKTSLRNSFFGWKANRPVAEPSDHLEMLRKAMLQVLEQGRDANNAALERKLLFASNIEELWYARPELMNAIAASQGESVARARLAQITQLFEDGTAGKPRARNRPIVPKA